MAIAEAISAAVERLSTQWPYVLSALLVCAVAWVAQGALKQDPFTKIPHVGSEIGDKAKRQTAWLMSAKGLLSEGYNKFRDGTFRVTTQTEKDLIVVSPRFLKELKDLPDDMLSFSQAVEDNIHSKYTELKSDRPITPHVIKRDLTPGLTRLNPTIAEEVDLAFQEEFPPCEDFTKIQLNQCLLRIVAKVSGRIFVGPELCRTEEYIDMGINYTIEQTTASRAISELRPEERAAKALTLEPVKALKTRLQKSYDFLKPVIVARKTALENDPDFQKPDDILQWILDDGQKKYGLKDDQELTEIQLGLTFAAIHTTTLATTNAFYTLATMPELMVELREEIRAVLREHGTFTTLALQNLKKLDSFMRENMRLYPLSLSSFGRKVLKTFTLSNGQVIPAGYTIVVPAWEVSHDDTFIENAHEFDAMRWYRMRKEEELSGVNKATAAAVNQMVSVTPTNLTFGYGRHACPGRFFAANEIKMIVARAVLNYDIATADGSKERCPNFPFGDTLVPDTSKELLFRRAAP